MYPIPIFNMPLFLKPFRIFIYLSPLTITYISVKDCVKWQRRAIVTHGFVRDGLRAVVSARVRLRRANVGMGMVPSVWGYDHLRIG